MNIAFLSVTGKRQRNEDACYVPRREDKTKLVLVADGMGGHAAGMLASTMAAQSISEALAGRTMPENVQSAVQTAIDRANLSIYRKAQSEKECLGMGTTLCMAVLEEEVYLAANVGDSRLYQYDGETLIRVSADHSLVETLVKNGIITREEAKVHPQRNVITRALGTGAYEEVDYFRRSWKEGDVLLLCTDGLHGSVEDEQIEGILQKELPLEEACAQLVDLALSQGSRDNITVVLVRNGGASV